MPTQLIAWLMSTFAFVMPLIFGQPAKAPDTRTSPYVEEMPPDKYHVWPTDQFETGDAPWWLPTYLLRPAYTLRGSIFSGTKNEGIVVLYKGKLVHEWYGKGWDKNALHPVYSVTKSVVHALVGIAIEEGYIKSVQDKIVDYFPGIDIKVAPELKKQITIEQMLTMTSGIAGDFENQFADYNAQPRTKEENEKLDQLYEEDSLKFLLEYCSMTAEPGERWNYSSMSTGILLGMIAAAIDQPLEDFVDERLFGPMGITHYDWGSYPDGTYAGGGGLALTPRDMAKFGYLYLNYGRWEDRQLVPADWVAQCSPTSKSPYGYGRLFWNVPFSPVKAYAANGAYGQYLDIVPGQDLVIARTATSTVNIIISF